MSILIVDDSPDIDERFETLLQEGGDLTNVLTATSAQEAFVCLGMAEVAQVIAPVDVILMDIQMPGMNGYTATKMIRQWEMEQGVMATPIIAPTAYARKEEMDCLTAGCAALVSQPIKKHALMQGIHQHTRRVAA